MKAHPAASLRCTRGWTGTSISISWSMTGLRRDETQAVQLDPELARAYFLRGAAFGGLGDRHNSLIDIETAMRLDPSLARYVTFTGEDASLTLPPL